MNRAKSMQRQLKKIAGLQGVFSLDVRAAKITDGVLSETKDAVLVIVAGVVVVLRQADMLREVPTFSLDEVSSFVHASNIKNHGAFVFSPDAPISHLIV
jgi:hypothetical protein